MKYDSSEEAKEERREQVREDMEDLDKRYEQSVIKFRQMVKRNESRRSKTMGRDSSSNSNIGQSVLGTQNERGSD
jgi:hypothetical protein